MEKVVKINCYIEEYINASGQICARIRDKETNKKVTLSGNNVDKKHFLMFLSQAKLQQDVMPTIYERNGADVIAILGCILNETDEEIRVSIDVQDGGYLFE